MRTTLTLDRDVADQAKKVTQKLGRPFKQVINEALRLGLSQIGQSTSSRPYRTKGRKMGLRPGMSLDNVQELLAIIEGEEAR